MPRVATKDTYGFERILDGGGDPIEIRRRIAAGDKVPDHYEDVEGLGEEVEAPDLTPQYKPKESTVRVRSSDLQAPETTEEIQEAVRSGQFKPRAKKGASAKDESEGEKE